MLLFYNALARRGDQSEKLTQFDEAREGDIGLVAGHHSHTGRSIEHPTGNVDAPRPAAGHPLHPQI
jgi:hypothetical protein